MRDHLAGHRGRYSRALAFTGLFLNLFNLLPVVPLDGGRAMAAMAPWMWGVGFAGMVVLALVFPNPVIFIIVLFAGYETYPALAAAQDAQPRAGRLLPRAGRATAGWSPRCTWG